jgi:O-antigen/teichoic acid export membrane protein
VLAALLPLAGLLREPGNPVPGLARRGWNLSVHALLAYLAFMSLAGLDLIWVNRELGGDQAGVYAGLVLLRRVVALLPGAAVTVMFPRIAACLAAGRLPDRLLANTAGVIFAACGALTAVFFLAAPVILTHVFSPVYSNAAPLLGWMALGMTGMAASSIWLNYYLAEKPAAYISFLFIGVALETVLLISLPAGLGSGVLAFGVTGWSLALAGLGLYLVKSRPALAAAQRVGSHA